MLSTVAAASLETTPWPAVLPGVSQHRVAHPAPAGAGGPSEVSLVLALGSELAVRLHPNSCAMMAPLGSTLSRPAAPTKSGLWPQDPRVALAKLKCGVGLS